jgi:type I restriction enzyme R subunit
MLIMTRRHNDEGAKERAKTVVDTFEKFIEENRDELTAWQIIYNQPYESRHITYVEIKRLTEALEKPPYNLTSELVWQAYKQLEKSKVREAGAQKLVTNIISLLRFATGESDVLEPFAETVNHRFNNWLAHQNKLGKKFTPEQIEWLDLS